MLELTTRIYRRYGILFTYVVRDFLEAGSFGRSFLGRVSEGRICQYPPVSHLAEKVVRLIFDNAQR